MKAIESVKKQSLQPNELIVVDDSIGQDLSSSEFVILKTGGSKGVSTARNIGILAARSDWIAFLDDDDEWYYQKLELQFKRAMEDNLDLVVSRAHVGNRIRPKLKFLLTEKVSPFDLLYSRPHLLWSCAYFPTSSYFIRRSLAQRTLFIPELTDRENLKFLKDCFDKGARIFQMPEVLVRINYNSKRSLSRINTQLEISWYADLKSLEKIYARNFGFESIRNLVRNRELSKVVKLLRFYLHDYLN